MYVLAMIIDPSFGPYHRTYLWVKPIQYEEQTYYLTQFRKNGRPVILSPEAILVSYHFRERVTEFAFEQYTPAMAQEWSRQFLSSVVN